MTDISHIGVKIINDIIEEEKINVEAKYRCIMDLAKTLSMEELQVLEKMLLDLWCDKLEEKAKKNVQSNIQK